MSTRGQVNVCEVISLKKLFTVHQLSKVCGVSRATILRLESKGLLTPAFVDEQTGYRYYDNFSASLILQVRLFLDLGMSYDDITLYYRSGGNSPELLERLEEKNRILKRAYKEIKLRLDKREEITFEFLTLPEYVCLTREHRGVSVRDRYQAMVDLYNEAIEKGYRPSFSEPLFGITKRTDYLRRGSTSSGRRGSSAASPWTRPTPRRRRWSSPAAGSTPACFTGGTSAARRHSIC